MKLIAIDTVAESCSAALMLDDECLLVEEPARHRHAERILPMIDSLLDRAGVSLADLDAVAFDRGPGSFTGLRIGAGVAQGIAFAAGLAVCPVSSLAVLAASLARENVLAAIDARMGQVYWALVRDPGSPFDIVERLDDPADVRVDANEVVGVGSGWDAYGEVLGKSVGCTVAEVLAGRRPGAEWVARLAARRLESGEGDSPEKALPVYLRDKVTG